VEQEVVMPEAEVATPEAGLEGVAPNPSLGKGSSYALTLTPGKGGGCMI